MNQYFANQLPTSNGTLFYMLVVTPEGDTEEKLKIERVNKDKVDTLSENHEFVRMSGNVIPIFKKV